MKRREPPGESESDAKLPAQQKQSHTNSPGKSPQPVTTPALPLAESVPAAGLPLTFDPVFYTWRELDVTATLQGSGNPRDPPTVTEQGITGHVLIEVWVDENGKVVDAKIIDAFPTGYFEEVTLAHYKNLTFTPAMKEGKPKRFRGRFRVDFTGSPRPIDPRKEN